ncbi:response regulator transcription factor [bacterium]|nr:response regulator transcription factor [bacterium]
MIRILIVDDHQIIRQGIIELLSRYPDFEVVGETGEGKKAVELAGELTPDIVIMDIAMPGMNGIEATRKIISANPEAKIIALSMYSDKSFITEILRDGAKGYLMKDCAFEELDKAIRVVLEGRTYLSSTISEIVINEYLNPESKDLNREYHLLTDREREVLHYIGEGVSTKQIAYELDVSVKTIETHRRNIMKKLDAKSIAELVKFAIRQGLTSLE